MTVASKQPLRIDPLPLISDRPDEAASLFHFDALVSALTGMLAARGNPTPFVFLVDGRWGTGKTSLMKTVMRAVEPVCGAETLRAAELPEDDADLRLVENNPLRWAPVRAVESDCGSRWSEFGLPKDDTQADRTPARDEARKRVGWLAEQLGSNDSKASAVTREGEPTERTASFFARFRPVRAVFFNAWKYKGEDELFPALAHELLAEMRSSGWLARMQAFSQKAASADWREAIARLAEAVPHAGGALGAAIRHPEWLQHVALYDRARPFVQGLTAAWATSYGLRADSAPRRIAAMLRDDVRNVFRHLRGLRAGVDLKEQELSGIVAVFIDDLDRCPREHVRAILKALNLLVDLESTAWILGADQQRLADAIGRPDGAIDGPGEYGGQFLSKIVQLHLVLPEGARDVTQMDAYLNALLRLDEGGTSEQVDAAPPFPLAELREYRGLLACGLPPNPRRVKELLNQAVSQLALLRAVVAPAAEETDEEWHAWALAALKYLLVVAHLPRSLHSDIELIAGLQRLAGGAPSPEAGAAGRRGASSAVTGQPALEDFIAKRPERERALWALVGPEDWKRILAVLTWQRDRKPPVLLDGSRLETLLTLGINRAVAPASAMSEAEEARAAERILHAKDDEEAAVTQRASQVVERLLDALLAALPKKTGGRPAAQPLLDAVTSANADWTHAAGRVLAKLLANRGLDRATLLAVLDTCQAVLVRALDDSGIARRENDLAWAMALRDAAVDLLDGKGQKDPWLESWQKEEGRRITRQLEGRDSEDLVDGEWHFVPAGPFISGDVVFGDELPVRVANVERSFWIDEHPVTVRRFRQFLDAQGGGYDLTKLFWQDLAFAAVALGDRRNPLGWAVQDTEERQHHPVLGVSWFEAAAFCIWRSMNGMPTRLPTEEQWEKAARGVLGRRWPWGCAWRPAGVVCQEPGGPARQLSPVGVNANASPFGARGMAGNCWEWTAASWTDSGFGEDRWPAQDSRGVDPDEGIVMRGGSFIYDRTRVRCAIRYRILARVYNHIFGFRCVRDVATT